MKQLILLIFLAIFSAFAVSAQKNKETLLTIGDTEISKAEFERIYKKNNENLFDESDRKTAEEYIDLFIDYKLKVIEAQNLKMDTSQSFREELAGYRKELAAPYLTDVQFNEKLVRETYDRMTKEVNASHILLRLEPNAKPEEEQQVLDKLKKIRQEIIEGKDFGEAAAEYSEDPSAKTNQGNLGYFSAFQMVAPFENAVFSLSQGEISEPVKTSFGYHLIKVNDIRENKGEIKVAHIMKMFPQGVEDFDKNKIKTEIDSIHNLLEQGFNFAELARKHSDDKRSAELGGEMPWFSAGRMIPEFSDAAFSIKETGDYTPPVETNFGYHIIKKLDHRPVKTFEEVKESIESRIKKDPARSVYSKKAFVEKLKGEYGFRENKQHLAQLENKTTGDELQDPQQVIFTLNEEEYTAADFKDFLQQTKKDKFAGNYDDWVEFEITEYENERLEEKYPEFRYLVREYHDGILLFNIMEEKIWNFAAQDSAGLQNFYEDHKNKYMWEERFRGSIIKTENDSVREEADKYFTNGMSNSEVLDLLNRDKKLIEIQEGAWEQGSNPVVDYYIWNGPEPEKFDPQLTFVRGDIIAPEPKTLEEAKGLYISDYQSYLEKEWLKKLRKKYKIKVNKKLLKTIDDA